MSRSRSDSSSGLSSAWDQLYARDLATRQENKMAYASGITRCIIKGSIAGVQDWSTGFTVQESAGPTTVTYADLLAFTNSLLTPVGTFMTAIAAARSAVVTWVTMRTEHYNGGTGADLIAEVPAGAYTVGSTAPVHDGRTCVVVTSLNSRPGRSNMNRSYVPALATPVSTSTLRVSTASQNVVLNAWKAMLASVDALTIGGIGVSPVVASRTAGTAAIITALRTDDLLDTQRRRQNDFIPVYNQVNYP